MFDIQRRFNVMRVRKQINTHEEQGLVGTGASCDLCRGNVFGRFLPPLAQAASPFTFSFICLWWKLLINKQQRIQRRRSSFPIVYQEEEEEELETHLDCYRGRVLV